MIHSYYCFYSPSHPRIKLRWSLTRATAILVFIALFFTTHQCAEAQFGQQGSKLVGLGATAIPLLGNSIFISADSSTAIAGGYNDSNEAGAAWVFIRTGSVWTQQGKKLVGTGAVGHAIQGVSVALSSD